MVFDHGKYQSFTTLFQLRVLIFFDLSPRLSCSTAVRRLLSKSKNQTPPVISWTLEAFGQQLKLDTAFPTHHQGASLFTAISDKSESKLFETFTIFGTSSITDLND